MEKLFKSTISTSQTEVFFGQLIGVRSELSEDVLEWLIGLYHQRRMGDYFVFDEDVLANMIPLDWAQEVDDLEVLVGQKVSGMDFYVPLLQEYLTGDQDILISVLDILRSRTLSDDDKGVLLTIVSESRREWDALQSARRKGIRNQSGTFSRKVLAEFITVAANHWINRHNHT